MMQKYHADWLFVIFRHPDALPIQAFDDRRIGYGRVARNDCEPDDVAARATKGRAFAEALFEQFGDDALFIAKAQRVLADDQSRSAWDLIVRLIKGEQSTSRIEEFPVEYGPDDDVHRLEFFPDKPTSGVGRDVVETQDSYYEQRFRHAMAQAQQSKDSGVRSIHLTMAAWYRELVALERSDPDRPDRAT